MAKSIEELIDDLKVDDEFTKEEAIALLEEKGGDAVEPLIEALLKNRNKNVKIGVATVLGAIGDSRAIDPLIKTLSNSNKLVRREASTSLGRMGEDAVEPLINVLDDEDWKVRGLAAGAL
ncbi:MAG: HEAT repeat domain-containing protein, partial [Methanobrevibacter sp.]|nr:HEAT repeat domain-containing protein [Methanobrevibacter sp.]